MIWTSQRRTRGPAVLVGLALTGLLLTGCGSSVGIHPGSAAMVGDGTVSMSTIDDTAKLYCQVFITSSQQSQQGQSGPQPMGLFRGFVAASLAKRLLGQALAGQYDVEPANGYQTQLSQIEQAFASAPADQRQAVIDVAGSDAYLQNVQVAIGQQLTGNQGQSDDDVNAALRRGEVATQEWLNDHDAFIDPVFNISVDGGKFTRELDQTSYPVSALASAGARTAAPDESYSSALPAVQRCG